MPSGIYKHKPCSEETKEKIRLAKKGIHPSNYKGYANVDGWTMVYNPNHPNARKNGYIFKHRLIMENHIGRFLNPEEVVHHLDGNKSNNDSNNLWLLNNDAEHRKYHEFVRQSNIQLLGGVDLNGF